jgi:outer membrane protein OmpA-like peptidoglycan-associated protein
MRAVVFYLIMFLLPINLFSQNSTNDSINAKSDKQVLREENANDLFKKKNYSKALPLFLLLLRSSPDSYDYNYKTGICYYYSEDEQSRGIQYFKKCITTNYSNLQNQGDAGYYLSHLYMLIDQVDSALLYFAEFIGTSNDEKDTKQAIKACLSDKRKKIGYLNPNLRNVEMLNSDFADNYPIMADKFTIYFASKRPTNTFRKTAMPDYNIYTSVKDSSGMWQPPTLFKYNTRYSEYPCFITQGGDTMYFACNKRGNFDIYLTTKKIDGWSEPEILEKPINSDADETGFTITKNNTIIISSNRSVLNEGFDLFLFEKMKNSKYKQTKMFFTINYLKGNKNAPSISADGISIFFSAVNDGSYDIFNSREIKPGIWTKPFSIEHNSLKNEVWYYSSSFLSSDLIVTYSPLRNYEIMQVEKTKTDIQVEGNVDEQKEKNILNNTVQVFNATTTAENIENLDLEKAITQFETLNSSQANQVIDKLSSNKVNSMLTKMDNNKAGELVDGMDIEKSIEVIEKMDANSAVKVLSSVDQSKVAEILQSVPVDKSSSVINLMNEDLASSLVQVMDPSTSTKIISNLDNKKVKQLINNMDADQVADVIDGMDIEKAVNIIDGMEEKKAIDVLKNSNDSVSGKIVKMIEKNIDNSKNLQKDMNVLNDYYNNEISNNRLYVFKTIYFEFGSSELLLLSKNELLILIDFLKNNSLVMAEIVGHTDNIGDWDYNLKLSQERAKVVYDFLLNNNISHKRIIFYGKGTADPISSNETQQGRDKNRRVELVLLNYKKN